MPEFGWGPVTFPFPGGTEPIVYGLSDGTPFLHWHFDTFDLPKLPAPQVAAAPPTPPPPTGSVLLSSSKLCRNQAFRFKNRLFGFQYHFELSEGEIEALVNGDKQTVARVLGADGADRVKRETAANYARYNRAGDRIVTNFVQSVRAYSTRSPRMRVAIRGSEQTTIAVSTEVGGL
jgi:GMP synthase-like glutamine amidotransferase